MREIAFPSGTTVFLSDIKVLNPAIDVQDDVLILGVSLPGIRVVQTKHGTEQRPDMILCILASKKFNPETKNFEDKPELFECTLDEFSKRGWFARIPITSIKQRWEATSIEEFLAGQAQNVDPYEVYEMVKEKWLYYIDFEKNPGAEVFASLWVIGTYFHFLFHYYPYLKWGGVKGVGKTKAGIVADGMCFNAEIFSGASESSIFRLASDTRGTQIIDEQEQLADEQVNAYIQVLNSGFQSSGAAIRTNKETMKVETWPTYSPKMLCSISGLRETLEDRAVEIVLYMSNNPEIKNREPPEWASGEWNLIRNCLYLLLFQKWKQVQQIYGSLQNAYGFPGRFWNISKPIIAIAKLIDEYVPEGKKKVETDLVNFLKGVLQVKHASTLGTNSARVVFALKQVLDGMNAKESSPEDHKRRIAISDVIEAGVRWEGEWFREEFKPKVIAAILKNLHLYSNPKRQKGGFTFETSLQEVNETIARYDLGEHDEHDERDERKNETGVDAKEQRSLSRSRSSHTPSSPSSPQHDERDEHGACTSNTSNTSQVSIIENKENHGPLGPKQDGICELCGKYGQLTRSEDGDLVCLDCIKESYAPTEEGSVTSVFRQIPDLPGLKANELCPPWLTTEQWNKLSPEERRAAWKNVPRREP